MQSIPQSWRMVQLGMCLQRRKDTVLPSTLPEDFVGLVGLEEIQDGGRGGITIRQTKPQEIESLKTRFIAGDILYGRLRPYLNKVGIAPQSGVCSTEIWAFTPNPLIDSRFASFFLASSFFVDRVASLAKGANLPRLDSASFDSIEIPLPPLSEQQRIVEILQEVEEISRLRVEAEAKTTELIPAIFFDHFVGGQDHDFQPLHKLAEVVSGVAIGRKMKGMTVEVPYLRVANVQAGFVDLSEIKTTNATEEEVVQFGLKKGDVLLTEGGDFDKLGRGCLWEGQIEPCIHQNHVFRVRPIPGKLNSQFFANYLQSAKAKHYFLRCAKKTTNLASINLTQLNLLPVPKISVEDQNRFELQIQAAGECTTQSSEKTFIALARVLSSHAFSGQLTADWREVNKDMLATEAHERDKALKQAGAFFHMLRSTMAEEIEAMLQDRTEGIYADLNREQHHLLRDIERMVGGVEYGRYFTAEQLASYVEGPLHRHPHKIESHLAVFAVRGIIVPVSRPRSENTGPSFAACYRLPVNGFPSSDQDVESGQGESDDIRALMMATYRKLASGNI